MKKLTAAQKADLLFESKQLNALRQRRNKAKTPSQKKSIQSIIDLADKLYVEKRIKYGQANLNPKLTLKAAIEVLEFSLYRKNTAHNKKMLKKAVPHYVKKMEAKRKKKTKTKRK